MPQGVWGMRPQATQPDADQLRDILQEQQYIREELRLSQKAFSDARDEAFDTRARLLRMEWERDDLARTLQMERVAFATTTILPTTPSGESAPARVKREKEPESTAHVQPTEVREPTDDDEKTTARAKAKLRLQRQQVRTYATKEKAASARLAAQAAATHFDDDDDDDDDDGDDDSGGGSDDSSPGIFDGTTTDLCKVSFFTSAEIDSFSTDMSKQKNREALPRLRAALEMRHPRFAILFDAPCKVYKKAMREDALAKAYDSYIYRTCQAARKLSSDHMVTFESEERDLMRTDPETCKRGRMLFERMVAFHQPKTARERREYIAWFDAKMDYFQIGAEVKTTLRLAADLKEDWEMLPAERKTDPHALLRATIEKVPAAIREDETRSFKERLTDHLNESVEALGALPPWDFKTLARVIATKLHGSAPTAHINALGKGKGAGGSGKGGRGRGGDGRGGDGRGAGGRGRGAGGDTNICYCCGQDQSVCGGATTCEARCEECHMKWCPKTHGGQCILALKSWPSPAVFKDAAGKTIPDVKVERLKKRHEQGAKPKVHATSETPDTEAIDTSDDNHDPFQARVRVTHLKDGDSFQVSPLLPFATLYPDVGDDGDDQLVLQLNEEQLDFLRCGDAVCDARDHHRDALPHRYVEDEEECYCDERVTTVHVGTAHVMALTQTPAAFRGPAAFVRALLDTGADAHVYVEASLRAFSTAEYPGVLIDGVAAVARMPRADKFWIVPAGGATPHEIIMHYCPADMDGVKVNILSHGRLRKLTQAHIRYEPDMCIDLPCGAATPIYEDNCTYYTDVIVAATKHAATQLSLSVMQRVTMLVARGRVGDLQHMQAARFCASPESLVKIANAIDGIDVKSISQEAARLISMDAAYKLAWSMRPSAASKIPTKLKLHFPGEAFKLDHWHSSVPCMLTGCTGAKDAVDVASSYGYMMPDKSHTTQEWAAYINLVKTAEAVFDHVQSRLR